MTAITQRRPARVSATERFFLTGYAWLCGLVVLFVACSLFTGTQPSDCALRAAQFYAMTALQEPLSASFPRTVHERVIARGNGVWEVHSCIAEETAFGLRQRHYFTTWLKESPGGMDAKDWELLGLSYSPYPIPTE